MLVQKAIENAGPFYAAGRTPADAENHEGAFKVEGIKWIIRRQLVQLFLKGRAGLEMVFLLALWRATSDLSSSIAAAVFLRIVEYLKVQSRASETRPWYFG